MRAELVVVRGLCQNLTNIQWCRWKWLLCILNDPQIWNIWSTGIPDILVCYIKICMFNVLKTRPLRQVQKQRNHIYALAFSATAGEKMILHIFSFLHIFYIYFYISGELTLSDISLMTSGIRSNVLELWDQQLHLENKNQCIWQLKTKIWQSVTTLSQILTNSFA